MKKESNPSRRDAWDDGDGGGMENFLSEIKKLCERDLRRYRQTVKQFKTLREKIRLMSHFGDRICS